MTSRESKMHGFVVDGRERAMRALEPRVGAEVTAEFAELLKNADKKEHARLRELITQEIECRLKKLLPPETLF
jgi:hypothetical protein